MDIVKFGVREREEGGIRPLELEPVWEIGKERNWKEVWFREQTGEPEKVVSVGVQDRA